MLLTYRSLFCLFHAGSEAGTKLLVAVLVLANIAGVIGSPKRAIGLGTLPIFSNLAIRWLNGNKAGSGVLFWSSDDSQRLFFWTILRREAVSVLSSLDFSTFTWMTLKQKFREIVNCLFFRQIPKLKKKKKNSWIPVHFSKLPVVNLPPY